MITIQLTTTQGRAILVSTDHIAYYVCHDGSAVTQLRVDGETIIVLEEPDDITDLINAARSHL